MDDGSNKFRKIQNLYNITEKNYKLQILLNYERLDALEFDTGVVPNIKNYMKLMI